MAKNRASNKTVADNGKAGINKFPKTKLRNALDKLAAARGDAETAGSAADNASLLICELASNYGAEAALITDDMSTILADWRDNLRGLTMELAIAGHKFAKLTEGKDDKPATAVLTGTGNNVLSIAKGVIDFQVSAEHCIDGDGNVSYRSVRTAVQGLRAERKAQADPDGYALSLAEAKCRETFVELCKVVFGQRDLELTEALAESLSDALAIETANVAAVDTLTDEAATELAAIITAQSDEAAAAAG